MDVDRACDGWVDCEYNQVDETDCEYGFVELAQVDLHAILVQGVLSSLKSKRSFIVVVHSNIQAFLHHTDFKDSSLNKTARKKFHFSMSQVSRENGALM